MKQPPETPAKDQTTPKPSPQNNKQEIADQDIQNWLEAERQLRGKLEREPTREKIVPVAEEIWREKNKAVSA
ncbi:MAG: hypothetical protein HYV68_02260 [Candidatus Taylorbacteria bacterium]|nr:hypothetical protein [Candidatus Taylorbacteria bacterium]